MIVMVGEGHLTNLDELMMKGGLKIPKVQFDSAKLRWDADDSKDDIDSEDEEDFMGHVKLEEWPGVDSRKYQNKKLHFTLLCMAVDASDDPTDGDWVPN